MDDPLQGERTKPAALQLELPGPAPAVAPVDTPAASASSIHRRTLRRVVIGTTLLAMAFAGVAELVLPRYVRKTCIDQAANHGIALAIDDVRINRGGFVLEGVRATASDLPGMSIEAPEVDVETLDLHPEKVTASGMELAVDGRWTAVSDALAKWRASEHGGQGGAWAPASLVVDGSRIVWRGAVGDDARFEAAGVHLDVTWQDREPTLHATSSNVIVAIPAGSLGPWRFDLDRDSSASRLRIALDPGVPEASTILLVGNGETITSADIAVPRSPVARLGIAPALLGVHGELQLAAALHYAPFAPPGYPNATLKGGLYGLAVQGIPRPLDVSWELAADGQRGAPDGAQDRAYDVTKGRIAVGPLVGDVQGTLKTFSDGFRIDLGWRAGPAPCAAFDAPLGPGEPFDIGYELRKLAENTGLTHIHGNVTASATLAFDSRNLASSAVNFAPKQNCDVAFGL